MRLALALGWPSVEWGLSHMGSQELTEWMAYFELEGFGDDRMDLRFARLLHLLANAHNDPKRNPAGHKLKDFLFPWQVGEDDGDNYEPFIDDEDREPASRQITTFRESLKARIG